MERREFVRLPKNYRVSMRKLAFPLSGQKKIELDCVDISCGGMRVQSFARVEEDQKLHVEISIPRLNKFHPGYFKVFESATSQKLKAVAKVAWVRNLDFEARYEVGIKFLDVDEDDWKALYHVLLDNL
ncbi:MAG: PilZ domain-containing protein [Thermodesulfobacteriota bacterium]